MRPSSDIAFSRTVKALQTRRGSRAAYAEMEANGGFRIAVDARLAGALAESDSAFLVTASADGQPYAQHRGGPAGFIRVLNDRTLGFADFAGNGQYISTGNLSENAKAFLFVMDYVARRRIKIWGRASVVEDDPALLAALTPDDYKAKTQAAIVFGIEAWDTNCAQHIPQKIDAADVERVLDDRQQRIAALEAEIVRLKAAGQATLNSRDIK